MFQNFLTTRVSLKTTNKTIRTKTKQTILAGLSQDIGGDLYEFEIPDIPHIYLK